MNFNQLKYLIMLPVRIVVDALIDDLGKCLKVSFPKLLLSSGDQSFGAYILLLPVHVVTSERSHLVGGKSSTGEVNHHRLELIEADDAHAARLELITTVTASLVELAHDHLDVGGGELKHKQLQLIVLHLEKFTSYNSLIVRSFYIISNLISLFLSQI